MFSEDSPAALVARYLRSNNYPETLEAFLREANLPLDAGSSLKNAITIEQVLSEKKTFDLSQNFERFDVNDDSRRWSAPAPSVAHVVATVPNPANVLHVSVDGIHLDPQAEEQLLIASTANKSLAFLNAFDPYAPRASEILSHGSPILSWIVLKKRFLIASSMSGHVSMFDLKQSRELWTRKDHQKYVVTLAHRSDDEGFWLATAGWDAKVLLYRFDNRSVRTVSTNGRAILLSEPLASITLPTNPESLLFIEHPELAQPVLLMSRRDSTFLYYHSIPESVLTSYPSPNVTSDKALPGLPLLGRQNLAPHSNAWIAFTPSAISLHPSDPSLIAIATSHVPYMKLIIARLLLPSPNPPASDLELCATAPTVLDATTGPIHNPTQASEARRLLAIQEREDAAIQLQMSTLAPQTSYSTPALAWRPDGSGVWVNADDGVVRGVEACSGKVVSILKDGHEAGSKVRCLWAGMVNGEEWVVSGGFDRRLIVWRCE